MKQILNSIIEPTLLLDEKRCRNNLQRMAEKAKANGIFLRPHFKTHQSKTIGDWAKDYGVNRIAVSSIRMAAYFAEAGWEDIIVAFPINTKEISRINEIASKTGLNLLLEDLESARYLEQSLTHSIGIFIEIDTGYNRTGLGLEDLDTVDELLEFVSKSSKLELKGLLAHAGHSYNVQGKNKIAEIHENSLSVFREFRLRYESAYPDLIYSAGDTPTCSTMDKFPGLTEMRPGNFVFYDLSQWAIGSCQLENIAVAMACPVVAKFPRRNEIVVYGGGVHFSKDRKPHPNGSDYYGLMVDWKNGTWSTNMDNAYIKSLSQEHGTISVSKKLMDEVKVGDILGFLPIHSCMTANLMKRYLSLDGDRISMMAYP